MSKSKFFSAPTDQYGKEIQFDVREDEEQQKKLQETVELLVAAGYFRARIKGLSAFDKIVGGMTWCITTCNFDVDVDLLFQESSTIGQKIALVEKIVSVLPRMKCPHNIEPHQIQGLDFIHIYPVIQWLVKKAIETRAEMGDLNRAFALSQFDKTNKEELGEKELVKIQNALRTLANLKESNAPQRKYARKGLDKIADRQVKIQSTLLEYGMQNALLSSLASSQQQQQDQQKQSKLNIPLKSDQQPQSGGSNEEAANLKRLMNEMSETDSSKQNKVTASAVGQILGLQQNELQQIVSDYMSKENELQQEIEQLEKLVASGEGSVGGFQHKQRLLNYLAKQIETKEAAISDKKTEIESVRLEVEQANEKINQLKRVEKELRDQLAQLVEHEKNTDKKSVDELQELVQVAEKLKLKEQEYKKSCKDELAKLESEMEKLKELAELGGESEDAGRINEQYETTSGKLRALRLKIAKKNREISSLKRKLDETPSRNELTQYQKRFIELYNQISAVHTQTKQFYILYNALEDKKTNMNKQINLFNSIHDQFNTAMSTQSNRDQFIKQLEKIQEGIRVNLGKLESKRAEEKSRLDTLNDTYASLIEKKRLYYKTLKDFQEECKKNEMLLAEQ